MKCLAVLCALGLLAVPAMASPHKSAPSTVTSPSIRVGDVLEVQVAGESGLSKSYTVDAAGQISLELVGQIPAAGRSAHQVAEELRRRLSRFLKQPTVNVAASTPARNEVVVTGEVLRPGSVKLRTGDTLLDALASVGGLAPNADGARATLVRRGETQPQPLYVEALLKGDLSHNLPLTDGDIVQIPKRELASFQVMGEVKQPGSRAFTGSATVLEAVLAAGGLTERADRSRVTLTRKNQAVPIEIDLEKVLAGEPGANLALQAGDVLSVGARMLVQVAGEVRTPGERLLRHGGTLMEAVLLAGGFGPDADRAAVQVTHRDLTTETFSLAEVTSVVGGPALRTGDLVVVKRAEPQLISITGAVRNQGQMKYQSGMKITDALMASGGLQENARWKEIRVSRGQEIASRQILVFNLEQYLKAPQTVNLALQPGDQIFVEAERRGNGKTVLQRLFEVLPLANLFFLR